MLAANPVRRSALLAAVLLMSPLAARAGETACWHEAGVLVVPAEVGGIAGDYVLDTGQPHTLLEETQAQARGVAGPRAKVRLAGLSLTASDVTSAKLDARFWGLPTPVAGVIGADLLAGLVLDVRFAPCRIGIWKPGKAPPFHPAQTLPLAWREGRPTVLARVADGAKVLSGAFVPATGSDTPVRLRDDLADAPGAARRAELYPYGPLRPRLRALSLAGVLVENAPAGLLDHAQFPADGEIGAPVLSRWRLRFDFAAGRLQLAP